MTQTHVNEVNNVLGATTLQRPAHARGTDPFLSVDLISRTRRVTHLSGREPSRVRGRERDSLPHVFNHD